LTLSAGRFEQRVRVLRRVLVEDEEAGNPESATRQTFGEFWASFRPEFGRQQLAAGRLESTTRAVITLRRTSLTVQIAPGDTLVMQRSPYVGVEFVVRGATAMPGNREIEFTVEAGGTP
jgi:head-tail adaptor